ncbi:interferon gamma [Ambystoma mexicanum]|uniref:interferon gamma n=1 Tax=Ambystoma mexicanum TaxID=8296 RepID=UPI0037E8FEF8
MEIQASLIFHCILAFCAGLCTSYPLDMQSLKMDCKALKEHFENNNLNGEDDGGIFQTRLTIWKDKSLKHIFLSQIIAKYLKMFETLNIASLQPHIDNIREELAKAREDHLLKPEDQLLKDLSELQSLEMSDVKIQRKAALELYGIFQEIALLSNPTVKRKRNQERRRRGSKN